jgi:hypothetical protein
LIVKSAASLVKLHSGKPGRSLVRGLRALGSQQVEGCGQVDRPRLGSAARGQVSSGFAPSGPGRAAGQVEWRLAAGSNGAGLVERRVLAGKIGRRAGVAGPDAAKAAWQP